ncbi:TIGR03084 family metal-binding protein [Streptomyces sp. V4-01]|uniref:TIGR03084 family metal-binding protein n=1 Tax=Actinacidiphila polyblastidii TaxID=3110430 RepID=A0ABU7PJL5_9ACTN|nr:TIGR03084 family metal-binding protein [Streptomyces sp. V4-01]
MPDPQTVRAVLDDLRAEGEALDGLVAGLEPARWATPTPAAGWTIAHQIAHLAWTDDLALQSVQDPDGFVRQVAAMDAPLDRYVDAGAGAGAAVPPDALLTRWRTGRAGLGAALGDGLLDARHPWYGPPMSTVAMANGRLMETWAHGQDVADALGVRRSPTMRLRHVARIAVRARDYAFAVNGRTPPREEFRVELTAPDGSLWAFGPQDAAQRVSGAALDFCLLAVQRRHRDDLAVRAEGADAERWLSIAQAFAGPPGSGRAPEGGSAADGGAA